jgi:hypothetical protein
MFSFEFKYPLINFIPIINFNYFKNLVTDYLFIILII